MNVDLFRKSVQHIVLHPEEHDQKEWAFKDDCGTKFCLAGRVIVENGRHNFYWVDFDDEDKKVASRVQSGQNIEELAIDLLDIDPEDAQILFHSNNSIEDLVEFFESFTGEKLWENSDD